MFNSISGIYPLDTNSTPIQSWHPKMSPIAIKCPEGQNHSQLRITDSSISPQLQFRPFNNLFVYPLGTWEVLLSALKIFEKDETMYPLTSRTAQTTGERPVMCPKGEGHRSLTSHQHYQDEKVSQKRQTVSKLKCERMNRDLSIRCCHLEHHIQPFILGQGSSDYGPWVKSGLWFVFINKSLLEHSHSHSFNVYGCLRDATAELNSCDRIHTACKIENTIHPLQKNPKQTKRKKTIVHPCVGPAIMKDRGAYYSVASLLLALGKIIYCVSSTVVYICFLISYLQWLWKIYRGHQKMYTLFKKGKNY